MPIVIFHGDNSVVLNARLDDMKKSYPVNAVERLSLKTESFEQLLMKLRTNSFFNDQRLFIVEDCDEKKIDPEKINVDSSITLALLFAKELSAASILMKWALQHNHRILAISQPQDKRIFTFLDLLAEKNNKAFSMFDELVSDFGVIYILTMVLFLLRRLVLPITSVPSFIEAKVKKQKANFSFETLQHLYEQTLLTDYQIKTGKIEEKTGLLLLVDLFYSKK